MRIVLMSVSLALLATSPANAEVTATADSGFAVSHKVAVSVDPDEAFAMLRTPAKWWAKEHTWTGSSDNLYMDAQAGGCFCELIPNEATTESGAPQRTLRGSVQHMQIVYVDPGKMLRMSGALGPLQGEAMAGTLTVTLAAVKGGTEMTFAYVAGGYMRMAVGEIAPAVDAVIGEQASRLAMALGPLVGGGGKIEPEPKPEPVPAEEDAAAADEAIAEPDADDAKSSVTELVADLEPDDTVSTSAADETPEDPEVAPIKPSAKPATRPTTLRKPAPESEAESGR